MDYASINMWAVLVAAAGSFIVGPIWYGPLFGKTWMKAAGLTEEDTKGANMVKIFGLTFILILVMAFGLAWVFTRFGIDGIDALTGLQFGLYTGIFFIASSYGINLMYQRKSFSLWLIDSGYQVLFMGLIGLILGAWH